MEMSRAVLLHKGFPEILGQRTYPMGIGNELVSLIGKCDCMIDPLKQQTAQFVFELLDLKGNGRL